MILPSRPRRCIARRLTAAGIFLLGLGGCATPQLQGLIERGSPGLPQRAELGAVPFHAQEDFQCGPAALAMVFGAAGKPIEPDALSSQVYLPSRKGSLQVEMLAATRRNGLVAIELKPSLSGVLSEIAAGNPVIVLQNLAFDWYPVWHYAVAIGYDLSEGSVTLRSGQERRSEIPMGTFERTWARGGSWAMLALPPGRMPASLSDTDYLGAVARLERAGSVDAAQAAYKHALQRWPGNLVALVGLGNTAYRLGDLEGAEQAFRRATLDHPFSAAAHNNLAQTLMEFGRDDEALAEARIAVGLGGPLEEVSVRTLDSIARHAGRGAQEWHQ